MSASPIPELLAAVDTLDVERVMALAAPEMEILMTDGRRAQGREGVQALLADLLSSLRSATHEITAQWHAGGVWVAEVDASYELRDGTHTATLPRAFIVHPGSQGLSALHVYGAHEHPLDELASSDAGLHVGGRWIPPL